MLLGPIPLRPLTLVLAVCSLASFAVGQSFTYSPTTTVSAETVNNTSAASSYSGQSNGNAASGNVSKLPTRNLLYSGSTTSVYAHFLPWFGQSNHSSVGYNSNDSAQVSRQVTDMLSRGIQGVIVDWYGQNFGFEDGVTQLVKAEAEKRNGQFVFAVMEDVGALNSCANTAGCSVTQKVISDLSYAYSSYMQSPAYMIINNRPVVFFFNVDKYAIDWAAVRAGVPGNPYFVFQGVSGFSHAQSDGSFSWLSVNASNPDDEGGAYLDSFYNTAHNYSGDLIFGSAYPGFNDSLAPWMAGKTPRVMNQHCGQTWINSMGKTANHYSSTDQLKAIQLVTWNDYEEGTEIESGVDNCIGISTSTTGSTLNWALTGKGKENTIDHYTVYISQDGSGMMPLGDVASGTHSYDLSKLGLAPGTTYQLYVKAIGVPSIHNQISAALPFVMANQPPKAVLQVKPTSGTAPLVINASLSGSTDPDGTIVSSTLSFGDGSAIVAGPTANHTFNVPGSYTVKGIVKDNAGASVSATQAVTVSQCVVSTVNRSVTICKPSANSTVTSPVRVIAYATDSSTVKQMAVFVDNARKYTAYSVKKVDTNISMGKGQHKLMVQANDSAGNYSRTIYFTVQ